MEAARKLGVERSHLYRVLTGERRNPGLLARYRNLTKQRSNSIAAMAKLSAETQTLLSSPKTPHETRN